jgi:hypothetical protein
MQMKYFVRFFFILVVFSGCNSGASKYKLSAYEKKGQKGYHANQAEKIIDENKDHKKANQKAADKNRIKSSEELTKLNNASANKFKKPKKHHGVFKYYWY